MADNNPLEEKKEPLLSKKYEEELKQKKVYVIQFPNPYDDNKDSEKFLEEKIPLKKARKQFFKVFKTSLSIELSSDRLSKEMKNIEDNSINRQTSEINSKNQSEAIPDMVKNKVAWLFPKVNEEKTKEEEEGLISRREFLKAVISAIVFTIEYELSLKYSLLMSRDKDELFCEIMAEEEWLKRKAHNLGYRLQLTIDPSEKDIVKNFEKFPFKRVSPYAKYEIPKETDKTKNLFVCYDDNEKPINDPTNQDEKKTIFSYNDRVRLIRSSLNTRLDLHLMKEFEISLEDFCLHSNKPLEELKAEWAHPKKVFSRQPLKEIRDYFGEKIGLYFAWMEVYKTFMIIAGVVGLVVQIILFLNYSQEVSKSTSQYFQVFFALFLAFWASAFDQLWGRREKILAWEWGTNNFYEEEEQRGEFKGKMERDPVSNKMKRRVINPVWSNVKKFISYSVIMVIIVSVLAVVWGIMTARWILKHSIQDFGLILAGIINAVQIRVMNIIFDKIATWLNDWENHETETEYNNRLAVKIFIFRFFNSYSSLFYLSYYCEEAEGQKTIATCMDFLGIQLAVIFFFSIILNIIELSVPYLLMKRRVIAENMKVDEMIKNNPSIRKELYFVEIEAKKESYESPVSDYIEMIIEFGYVALFGTSLPVLPLLLLFEILFEIRVDAWKICNIYKRADPHRSEDIGVFKDIILIMAYVGAINNSGIIIFTSGIVESIFDDIKEGDLDFYYLIAFVVLEHILLIGMFLISVLIPDNPEIVEKGLIWSERKINERLYNSSSAPKLNYFKVLAQNAINKQKEKTEFMLQEKDLAYDENK